ncbi:MAG: hypothetical protein RLZZ628_247 [Bacteroidota bacterium]|jgi:hypothetical protein
MVSQADTFGVVASNATGSKKLYLDSSNHLTYFDDKLNLKCSLSASKDNNTYPKTYTLFYNALCLSIRARDTSKVLPTYESILPDFEAYEKTGLFKAIVEKYCK